jgi:hypothetical protein
MGEDLDVRFRRHEDGMRKIHVLWDWDLVGIWEFGIGMGLGLGLGLGS